MKVFQSNAYKNNLDRRILKMTQGFKRSSSYWTKSLPIGFFSFSNLSKWQLEAASQL